MTEARADIDASEDKSRLRELYAFLFITVVLAPAVTLAVVGGYGFLVWMYQLVAGPPGSH